MYSRVVALLSPLISFLPHSYGHMALPRPRCPPEKHMRFFLSQSEPKEQRRLLAFRSRIQTTVRTTYSGVGFIARNVCVRRGGNVKAREGREPPATDHTWRDNGHSAHAVVTNLNKLRHMGQIDAIPPSRLPSFVYLHQVPRHTLTLSLPPLSLCLPCRTSARPCPTCPS